MPASGCPGDFVPITTNANGWTGLNATSGTAYVNSTTGNQLGRIDMAVAPSNSNYIYAQVQSIRPNSGGCGSVAGCQLGAYRTTDGGVTWTQIPGSLGTSLTDCAGSSGDYNQNWYDQGIAIDPNNPNRAFFDTFEVWFWDGSTQATSSLPWNDLTCAYNSPNKGVHPDQHALAFVPGSSSILLAGDDGGVHGTTNANLVTGATDPTWFNMDAGLNTIEFYSGDISGNFATSAAPQASGGAQDNGAASVSFQRIADWPGPVAGGQRRRRILFAHRSGRHRIEPALFSGKQQRHGQSLRQQLHLFGGVLGECHRRLERRHRRLSCCLSIFSTVESQAVTIARRRAFPAVVDI